MIDYLVYALFTVIVLTLGVAFLNLLRRYKAEKSKWKREDTLLNETAIFFHHALDDTHVQTDSWLCDFASLVMTGMDVDGVLIANQEQEKSDDFLIMTAIGTFDHLYAIGQTVKQPRGTSAFAWTSTPQRLNSSELRAVLPSGNANSECGLLGPLKVDPSKKAFILLVRGTDKPTFEPHDQQLLNECINVAELGLALKHADSTISQLNTQIETAHEEGMLQVASGLIHNIGNGIATIQMALNRFKTGGVESLGEVAELMGAEILPEVEKQLADGTLQDFLLNDEQGKEYLSALNVLVSQITELIATHNEELEFITDKFENITEIVDLQQRFIGELGTESMCSINSIISHVLTHCKASLEKQDIDLKVDIQAEEKILVDRPMLHHIFAMLLQQAIEASRLTPSERPKVKITAKSNDADYEGQIVVHIHDNGVGQDVDLSDTSQLKSPGSKARLLSDLLFVRKIIEKYGGTFELKGKYGAGMDRILRIPFKDDSDDDQD